MIPLKEVKSDQTAYYVQPITAEEYKLLFLIEQFETSRFLKENSIFFLRDPYLNQLSKTILKDNKRQNKIPLSLSES